MAQTFLTMRFQHHILIDDTRNFNYHSEQYGWGSEAENPQNMVVSRTFGHCSGGLTLCSCGSYEMGSHMARLLRSTNPSRATVMP